MSGLTQIEPRGRWPGGDSVPIAVLGLEPSDLRESCGLTFHEGVDDLDYFERAAVQLDGDIEIWLVRYLRAPARGTQVIADVAADHERLIARLIDGLGLTPDDVTWRRPD